MFLLIDVDIRFWTPFTGCVSLNCAIDILFKFRAGKYSEVQEKIGKYFSEIPALDDRFFVQNVFWAK